MWLLDGIAAVPANESRVTDLTLDSRAARAGSLFLALPGRSVHGLKFAAEAARRGASAVLYEPSADISLPKLPADVFAAAIPGLEDLVGRIADRFFNWPSSQLRVTGITGTNGKTTCAYLLAQCLEKLGSQAAYMGTIGWGRTGSLAAATLTTPDAVTLHRRAGAAAHGRRARGGDGGVIGGAGPGSRGGGALRHGGIHQSEPRSPGLSRQHGRLRRRQGAAVRRPRPQAHHHQCGRCLRPRIGAQAGRTRAAHRRLDGRRGFGLAGRARSVCRASNAGFAWHFPARERQLRRAGGRDPAARPLQRRELPGGHRLSAVAGRLARRRGAGAGRLPAAAGPHGSGRGRGARQAPGRGRLRPYPRCARQGAGGVARALQGRAMVRVRLRRATAIRASAL